MCYVPRTAARHPAARHSHPHCMRLVARRADVPSHLAKLRIATRRAVELCALPGSEHAWSRCRHAAKHSLLLQRIAKSCSPSSGARRKMSRCWVKLRFAHSRQAHRRVVKGSEIRLGTNVIASSSILQRSVALLGAVPGSSRLRGANVKPQQCCVTQSNAACSVLQGSGQPRANVSLMRPALFKSPGRFSLQKRLFYLDSISPPEERT